LVIRVTAPPTSSQERETTVEDFVTVATHYSMAEAEPERLALEAAGISAMATDESVGTLLVPNLVGGIKIQVPAAEAARAEAVLAELREAAQLPEDDGDVSDDGVSFKCPSCQAEIWFPSERRGQVEVCPECGAHVDVPAENTAAG
jgi:hypothetical protein